MNSIKARTKSNLRVKTQEKIKILNTKEKQDKNKTRSFQPATQDEIKTGS
jgi:hypothetical protein